MRLRDDLILAMANPSIERTASGKRFLAPATAYFQRYKREQYVD